MSTLYNSLSSHTDSFFLIAGPCAVENESITLEIAEELKLICEELDIPLVFKASFKKANRTNVQSFSGIGDDEALEILAKLKKELDLFITTDIHESKDAEMVASVVDIIQIPAFLCRQTELLLAASRTERIVNVKKGQFMSGQSMSFAAEKVKSTGNHQVLLTERGNSFGYEDLVVDMRNIAVMQENKCPVVLDCTHANQKPNQSSGVTNGTSQFIELLAKAGIASGADGLFIETHPNPSSALSDGSNMLELSEMRPLLKKLIAIKRALTNA